MIGILYYNIQLWKNAMIMENNYNLSLFAKSFALADYQLCWFIDCTKWYWHSGHMGVKVALIELNVEYSAGLFETVAYHLYSEHEKIDGGAMNR